MFVQYNLRSLNWEVLDENWDVVGIYHDRYIAHVALVFWRLYYNAFFWA